MNAVILTQTVQRHRVHFYPHPLWRVLPCLKQTPCCPLNAAPSQLATSFTTHNRPWWLQSLLCKRTPLPPLPRSINTSPYRSVIPILYELHSCKLQQLLDIDHMTAMEPKELRRLRVLNDPHKISQVPQSTCFWKWVEGRNP